MDKDGLISSSDIKNAFTLFGRKVSDVELETIFKAHDSNNDRFISKEEFINILL